MSVQYQMKDREENRHGINAVFGTLFVQLSCLKDNMYDGLICECAITVKPVFRDISISLRKVPYCDSYLLSWTPQHGEDRTQFWEFFSDLLQWWFWEGGGGGWLWGILHTFFSHAPTILNVIVPIPPFCHFDNLYYQHTKPPLLGPMHIWENTMGQIPHNFLE